MGAVYTGAAGTKNDVRPLILSSSRPRNAAQFIPLMLGLIIAVLGVAFPKNANVPACLAIGSVLILFGLFALMFKDELTVRPDGMWQRRRGLGPFAGTTMGSSPLSAAVRRWESPGGTDSVRRRKHYHIVVRFPEGPEMVVWPDARLLAELRLRPGADRNTIAAALDERLRELGASARAS